MSSDKVERWLQDESFINWAFRKNDSDSEQWEAHFALNPEEGRQAEEARSMLVHIVHDVDVPKAKSVAALARLDKKLDSLSMKSSYQPPKRTKKGSRRILLLSLAATAAIVVSFLFLVYPTESPERMIKTAFGERLSFMLPDESEVVLNANSKLTYQEENPREIWIDGEAYFKVKKSDVGERFVVHTDDLRIEVLGTTFNVNSRRARTKVFLEEGKINLDLNDSTSSRLILEPGDQVTYSAKKGKSYEKVQKQVEPLSYWKNGVIEMKDTELEEVMFRIEEVYGVQIKLGKEDLRHRKINLVIPTEELDMAFKQLEYALDLEVKQLNDRIYSLE